MVSEELSVLTEAFRKASRIVLEGDRTVSEKATAIGMYDVVTGPDKMAEESIIASIRARFPDDVIVSEETNPDNTITGRTWVFDPIDGTMNYSHGIPLYGIQGTFMEDGVPRATAIYLPEFDEMFTACDDGAFLNGSPIHSADAKPLRKCLLATGDFSRRCEEFRAAQAALLTECRDDVARFKMFGASSVDFAYLACGRLDVHVRFINKVWDFIPGMHLAEAAGAVYDKRLLDETRLLILCSSEPVLDEALDRIVPVMLRDF